MGRVLDRRALLQDKPEVLHQSGSLRDILDYKTRRKHTMNLEPILEEKLPCGTTVSVKGVPRNKYGYSIFEIKIDDGSRGHKVFPVDFLLREDSIPGVHAILDRLSPRKSLIAHTFQWPVIGWMSDWDISRWKKSLDLLIAIGFVISAVMLGVMGLVEILRYLK
jgi:hypothetical protein